MESENHSKNGANLKSKMNRFLFIGFVLLSFLTVGCDSKDDNDKDPGGSGDTTATTTVAEDKANIQASFDRTKNLLESFKNGGFYKFADEFIDYEEREVVDYYYSYVGEGSGDWSINPETWEYEYTPGRGDYVQFSYNYYEGAVSEFTEMLVEKLGDVIDSEEVFDEDRFSFESLSGSYVWDNTKESWNKNQNSTVLVSFPSSKSKTSNDIEAAITAYEDTKCDIEGEEIYLPTKVNIYLKKDNEKLFSTDVAASFTNYGIPKQVDVNVYAKPLTFDVSLKQDSPKKFKVGISIKDETEEKNNLAINCEATLSNDLDKYSDFDDMELNSLKFDITQHELSIVGSVDLKTLSGLSETTESINKCIDFTVSHKTQIVGTLKAVDEDDETYLYIVYKDGTQENTSIYWEQFIEDIEELLRKYLD
jgi:hypothetical protein